MKTHAQAQLARACLSPERTREDTPHKGRDRVGHKRTVAALATARSSEQSSSEILVRTWLNIANMRKGPRGLPRSTASHTILEHSA
eukprot:7377795-Prymnesium_polylepis.4